MDSFDRVIWILPFLALLDVVSTLYLDSLGEIAPPFVRGFFSAFSIFPNLLVTYSLAVFYVMGFFLASFALFYTKSKLDPLEAVGKLGFLFLLVVVGFIYLRLTASFIVNFFYFPIVNRGISLQGIALIIYASTVFSLAYYTWQDVVAWLRSGSNQKP